MKINYILTLILVFCIGASIPILTGSSQVNEQHSAESEVPYCVTPPTVPAQVTFDGETIDLRRYDRRERMDREMMVLHLYALHHHVINQARQPLLSHHRTDTESKRYPRRLQIPMVIESNLNNIARSPAGAAVPVAIYACHRTGIRAGSER